MTKKPSKNCEYKCPHGKNAIVSVSGFDKNKTVTANYCKNNCSIYKKKGCKLFNGG